MFSRTVATCLLVNCCVSPAYAVDEDDFGLGFLEEFEPKAPEQEVIQNRKYDLLNEVIIQGGGLPVDPYYKGLVATGGYALHFSDFAAWEVVNFNYSYNMDSDLKKKIVRIALATGASPPEFPEITWFATSRLVIKPFYGKQALFNKKVLHVEAFLMGGPALVKKSEIEGTMKIGVDAAFGLRLWLSDHVSLRMDMGELIYWEEGSPSTALHVHVGMGFNLRGEQ